MTILKAGTFKVSDFRKAIPDMTKVTCVLNQDCRCGCGCGARLQAPDIAFDHRPPLSQRDYDTEAGDFIPGQNDTAFLRAIRKRCHDQQTFGPGGERRIHTRGSDRSEPGRLDKIAAKHSAHVERQEIVWPEDRGEPIGRVLSADLAKGEFTVELNERGASWVKEITSPKPRTKAKKPWPKRPMPKRAKSKSKRKRAIRSKRP